MSEASERHDGTRAEREAGKAADPTPPQRARAVDWVVTIPFLVVFGLILLIFDPLQRLVRLFGPRPHEIVVGIMQVCLLGAFRLCGTRLNVDRSPAVAPRAPYLVIANHQSMFDIPILGALLFTNYPKYVSKRELSRWLPSISYNLRRGGNALIDRSNRVQAERAIRALGARAQKRGVSAVIYPEGTRSRSGELGRFRRHGALALLEAAPELAVVPVTIDGSWRLLCHNLLPVPFGVPIRLRFGAPIPRQGPGDGPGILTAVREEIAETLQRWRSR